MNPSLGLYRIKDEVTRQTEMLANCRQLLDCLPQAIRATEEQSPVREQGYLPDHADRISMTPPEKYWRESHWEDAMWRYWRDGTRERAVDGAWVQIVNYQVMLRGDNDDSDWGEVDLLGLSESNLPVVIELKSARSTETPLRILVEAAAYGIALRKAWAAGGFADEWRAQYGNCPMSNSYAWPIVCAAPSDYWQWCFQRKALQTAWPALHQLVVAFKEHGLSPVFVEVKYTGNESADPRPVIVGAQIVGLPQ